MDLTLDEMLSRSKIHRAAFISRFMSPLQKERKKERKKKRKKSKKEKKNKNNKEKNEKVRKKKEDYKDSLSSFYPGVLSIGSQ